MRRTAYLMFIATFAASLIGCNKEPSTTSADSTTKSSGILDKLKSLPGAALVIESIEHWWAEHPLHAAGSLAEEASRRYVEPIARKNPLAVVVGSAVFGALLVASRPWRWLLRPWMITMRC